MPAGTDIPHGPEGAVPYRRAGEPGYAVRILIPRRPCWGAAIVILVVGVWGCNGPAPSPEPRRDLPPTFSRSGDRAIPDRWWRGLDDPVLNTLVQKALSGSPSLRATRNRLQQARAIARREGADTYPTLDASASAQRTERDGPRDTDQVNLGATASYEVDLWGRVEAGSDAARLDAKARRSDLRAAAIALSANVARTWYSLTEARARRDLVDQQLETNRKVLKAVEARFRQGLANAADVLRQQQLVDRRSGDLARIDGLIDTRANELAVLMGKVPKQVDLPKRRELVTLSPIPDTGVPARLLQRRPDVRQSFFAVQAADRRVAVALANRYPRLDLTASFDTTATSIGALFQTWIAQTAAQLGQPLFDAGRRKAEVNRSKAVLSERLNQYEDSILTALREVEDALADERATRREVESLTKQQQTAEAVVQRLRSRYARGATDFLDVLDSLTSQQDVARRLLAARRDLILARVELARALAGGWRLQAPDQSRAGIKEDAT